MGTREDERLAEDAAGGRDWRLWGTFLPERQWGTVREDYSADGDAWSYMDYDTARVRAYRWTEDGLLGWCDREARLSFAVALWNGRDPHLKEKLFGLTNSQGNHGEDVKELYYYVDATPTGSYARALYRYPQAAYPYRDLVDENARRGVEAPEYELLDTGVFAGERYFDVQVEYAKQGPDDTLIRLTITNRGAAAAEIAALPTLTFRNVWDWDDSPPAKPIMTAVPGGIRAEHGALGTYHLQAVGDPAGTLLFTENASNRVALGWGGASGFSKDAFHRYVVDGATDAVDPAQRGTKAAFLHRLRLPAGGSTVLRLRLSPDSPALAVEAFDAVFDGRIAEADEFYAAHLPPPIPDAERLVARQAYAGLLWSKQVYHYDVKRWLAGDKVPPPPGRADARNSGWAHMRCLDVISMPDKWEYPWFATWDLAFHTIPLAQIDPAFAKGQLLLMLSERYQRPNGALPAYEFGFGDTNPPVHAMAVWQVYETDRKISGRADTEFLEKAFMRLLLNFTWWVNVEDPSGKDLFGGGFLGLDNIGVFDRNTVLPDGRTLNQADATAWMGLFCSAMLTIAVELAQERALFGDMAIRFFHHFMLVVEAMNRSGGAGLWDEETGFYYDRITVEGGDPIPLAVQSVVGLVPIFALAALRNDQAAALPDMQRVIAARLAEEPQFAQYVCTSEATEGPYAGAPFVALVPKDRLLRLLERVLDETQFLSPFGIRSVSKRHRDEPFSLEANGKTLTVAYVPGEGNSNAFGGNSNWRGPVWFPINTLLIHALQRAHQAYGDGLTVECPVGSGQYLTLGAVAAELSRRLTALFLPDEAGRRPCHGGEARYATQDGWRDLVLFSEYFHGDTGRGIGASHQTGWTGVVATCITLRHT